MDLKLETIKREYLRKILDVSLNNRNYSTVVFEASFCLDELKEMMKELKDEYHIDNVIFIDFYNNKVKSFFESNPTEKEIERFIPRLSKPVGNIKGIYFHNAITDYSATCCSDYSINYYKYLSKYNKELFDKMKTLSTSDKTIVAFPNKEWATALLGSEDRLGELWIKINKILSRPSDEKKEIEERIQRKNELNKMGIHNLYFYTNLGTDFRISLNPDSIWVCEPNDTEGIFNFVNYPSYEIYTSPNCYSAEGKIVLSQKRRFYYDILVNI